MSGLYVRTNPVSITAQNQLNRNMAELSDVLTRLSTGLRINSGKDDPAGLIASELLKSDITGLSKAISNSQRANSIIGIADSALGQISNLLNDIKGLIVESANTVAMSSDQIKANQLQVDASLDSIDRIAKTTNYQGSKLLDGSMDFETRGVRNSLVTDLKIHEANFGTQSQVDVDIQVKKESSKAQLVYDKAGISEAVVLEVGGNNGTEVYSFDAGAKVKDIAEVINRNSDATGVQAVVGQEATYGQLLATSAGLDNDINFMALVAGYDGGNYTIKYSAGDSDKTSYKITPPSNGEPGVIEFFLKMNPASPATSGTLDESFNGIYTSELANGFVVQSDNGKQVKSYSIALTTDAATQPSADFNAATGHLQLLLNIDPITGEVTTNYADLAAVINKNTGLNVVQYGSTNATTGASLVNLGNPPWAVGGGGGPLGLQVTKANATDVRANNALNVTALINGTQFDNTDVVYLQGDDNLFTASTVLTNVAVGGSPSVATDQILTIKALDPGEASNGWTFVFDSAAVANAAVTGANEITIKTGATIDDINTALAGLATKFEISVAKGDGSAVNPAVDTLSTDFDTNANAYNATTNTATAASTATSGGSLVRFDYTNGASKSGVTVSSTAATAGGQYFRLSAKSGGSDYNEVGVEFVNTGANQPLSVVYDETAKVLRVYGGTGVASLGELKAAIEANSPFNADFYTDASLSTKAGLGTAMAFSSTASFAYDKVTNSFGAANEIMTGQTAGDLGTNHQGLIITVADGVTAAEVVAAFRGDPLSSKFSVTLAGDNNGSGTIFWNSATEVAPGESFYNDPASFVYVGAMTGGSNGYTTDVTAKELVDFVNNDETLSQILRADLALNTPTGSGYLTLFDEYAYYGDPINGTGLQFLGPKGSADVIFASQLNSNGTKKANQELAMWFTEETPGYSSIAIPAKNPNAAVQITADNKGSQYDDMVVRYVRLGNDSTQSYVTYEEGPSNAMAYCSVNEAGTGTANETGKFIVYSKNGGDMYNEVSIVAKLDYNQKENAVAYYDAELNQLVVSVNDVNTKLTDALAAINNEGTFTADYDFSFNHNVDDTGPGNATFANVLSASKTSAVIGNTGQTGGHTGGVMTVYLAGDDLYDTNGDPIDNPALSAQSVVDLINSDPVVSALFTASNYGTSNGTGQVAFREDNLKEVTGGCGQTLTVPMATSSGGVAQPGQMVIQLATDQYGNYTTTAAELVAFFDQLTSEQTRGVSVSLVLPVGADNLLRSWTVDECGNVIESQECENPYGGGILKPLFELDECDQLVYEVIQFTSYGSNIQPTNANDDVVTVNGWQSMFNISAKNTGPDYEGVSLVYEKITDVDEQPSASYDAAKKQIVVRILEGVTTADQVKAAIDSGLTTKDLFNVTLKKDGTAAVTLSDDSLSTINGTYEAGYRGGARMLGGADDDPHKLTFVSIHEGSDQRVSVKAKSGNFEVKDTNGDIVDTTYGEDMEATINGMKAAATGRALSIDTTTLKIDITLADTIKAGDSVQFAITGGGGVFQVGPDVVSNQQLRIGIQSVNTASLGGVSGRLYQLRKGGNADLITSDESRKLADQIISEAIVSIAQQRGRLGTIQRSTLEPTISALQDQMEALITAEAQISNADFAEESSRLTRAQILVQSGSRALSLANQFPQYAASLLGG